MTQPTKSASGGGQSDLQEILSRIEATLRGKLRYFDSDLHGLSHLREVAILAGQIAAESGIDVEVAMVAGFPHDCGRVNDGGGNEHAIDSARLARRLLMQLFPHLDADKICQAIASHADGLTTDDILVGALWDADRLTLVRLGRTVREDLLSTPAARRMLKKRTP